MKLSSYTLYGKKVSFVLFKHFVACVPVRLSLLSEVRYFRWVVTFKTLRYLSPYHIMNVNKEALRLSSEIRHR